MKSAFLCISLAILPGFSLCCDKPQPSKSPPVATASPATPPAEAVIELLDRTGPDKRITDDEVHYLPGILAKPKDAQKRAEYAGWLEQQDDARAKFVRMDNTVDRISFVEWVENGPLKSNLDFYAREFPQVKREIEERKANQSLRSNRRALASTLKPSWVAFMRTLACPFQPLDFFDNTGPQGISFSHLPFAREIGTRGMVVTFDSSFTTEKSWDAGLMLDLDFLCRLKLANCSYGKATCPVHPLICELKNPGRPLTARDILDALTTGFRSKFISNLDVTSIENLGHHVGDDAYKDDEIHNDFTAQLIFPNQDEKNQWLSPFVGTHGLLKRSVTDGKLWYVLLRTRPVQIGPAPGLPRYIILFAVGKSPNGDRLIGVVTHQHCNGF